MRIEKINAQPNRQTFLIKPVWKLLCEEIGEAITNTDVKAKHWIDPFSGNNSPALWTNDINNDVLAVSHMDALEYLKAFNSETMEGAIYDPPYSLTQATVKYKNCGYGNKRYWAQVKNELARIVKPGGKAICFGWNSGGLGMSRGFTCERILLIGHGGGRNDTIATVEIKKF